MRFNLRQLRCLAVVLVTLIVVGLALRGLERPVWRTMRAAQPTLRLEAMESALGQGVTVALLGGFRALLADFFWLRTNAVWERNDLPATQTFIKLVTAIDPRPLYFWLNGSRMIAYDMPVWRIRAAGGFDAVSAADQRKINDEQARVALRYLDEARAHHPDSAMVVIEMANIHLNRREDLVAAAAAYRQAAEMPDAPYFAARIHAELLRRQGRYQEAYAWLVRLYPTLPRAMNRSYAEILSGGGRSARAEAVKIEMAMAEVVLARIRELEGELGISVEQAFVP